MMGNNPSKDKNAVRFVSDRIFIAFKILDRGFIGIDRKRA